MVAADGHERLRDAQNRLSVARRQNEHAVDLGRVLSLASAIEPSLVRRARYMLAGLDAAAEADLWFGPLVESRSPSGLMLNSDVAELLRSELAGRPHLLEQAWTLVKSSHATAPWSLRLEEEINYASVALTAEERSARIGELLRAVMRAIPSGDPQASLDTSRWLVRALGRLPRSVRDMPEVEDLARGTTLRLTGTLDTVEATEISASSYVWLGRLLPPNTPQLRVGLHLADGVLTAGPVSLPGSQAIIVPLTRPVVLQVFWNGPDGPARDQLYFEPGGQDRIRVRASTVEVRTLMGARFELRVRTPARDEKAGLVLVSAGDFPSFQAVLEGRLNRLGFKTGARDVENADSVLLIVSSSLLANQEAARQCGRARRAGTRILAVQVGDLGSGRAPAWMKRLPWFDLRGSESARAAAWQGLVRELDTGYERVRFVNSAPVPSPGPPPVLERLATSVCQSLVRGIVESRPLLVALVGPASSGKSLVAGLICAQGRKSFDGGVLWVSLGENTDLQGRMADQISLLTGRPHGESADLAVLSVTLRRLLEKNIALLVLDDVKTVEQASCFLEGRTAPTLITTRDAALAETLGAHSVALEILPDKRPDLARVQRRRRELEQLADGKGALAAYREFAAAHEDVLFAEERVALLRGLADLELEHGSAANARDVVARGLLVQPGNRELLDRAALVAGVWLGNWEDAIARKRDLLRLSLSPEEQIEIWRQIVEIQVLHLKDLEAAVESCAQVASAHPQSEELLATLESWLHVDGKDREGEALVLLADSQTGSRRARLFERAAQLADSRPVRIDFLMRALEAQPDRMSALAQVSGQLNAVGDAQVLLRLYQNAAKALGEQPDKQAESAKVWDEIAGLMRGPLNDSNAAIEAFRMALKFDPKKTRLRAELAELLEAAGAYREAAAQLQSLLNTLSSKGNMAALARNLRHLYRRAGLADRARCCLAVLVLLNVADEASQTEFDEQSSKAPAVARRALTVAEWETVLIHPGESQARAISEILRVVSWELARLWSKPPQTGDSAPRSRKASHELQVVSRLCLLTIETLNVRPVAQLFKRGVAHKVELFTVEEGHGPSAHVTIDPDLGRSSQKDLAFLLGQKLSLLRADLPLCWACDPPPDRVQTAYAEAVSLVRPGSLENASANQQWWISRLASDEIIRLRTLVDSMPSEALEGGLDRWTQGVAHTAARAGLLISGDIVAAARILRRQPHPHVEAIVDDLIRWSLSEEYFTLRESLGLDVEVARED